MTRTRKSDIRGSVSGRAPPSGPDKSQLGGKRTSAAAEMHEGDMEESAGGGLLAPINQGGV